MKRGLMEGMNNKVITLESMRYFPAPHEIRLDGRQH